jgi:hypothetical protein
LIFILDKSGFISDSFISNLEFHQILVIELSHHSITHKLDVQIVETISQAFNTSLELISFIIFLTPEELIYQFPLII